MRRSLNRHVLSILRGVIGLNQVSFHKLIDVSLSTVVSIEVGRLKLSESLAERISIVTGVDYWWLLENDTTRPPIDLGGKPYTKATFESVQAECEPLIELGMRRYEPDQLLPVFLQKTAALLIGATKQNREALCGYRLNKALDDLLIEFGVRRDDPISSHQMKSHDILPALGDDPNNPLMQRHLEPKAVLVIFKRELNAALAKRPKLNRKEPSVVKMCEVPVKSKKL